MMDNQPETSKELNQLKSKLRELSIASLDELAPGVGDFLHQMGEQITPKSLADAIVDIKRTTIFEEKKIRKVLLELYGIPMISSWADNKKCNTILDDLGLSKAFLPVSKATRPLLKQNTPAYPMHDYQDWLKKKVSRVLIGSDQQRLMVQMPTGAGKTWTMMESIYDFIRLSENENPGVIWMAHTDELCEQAIESFDFGWKNKGSHEVNSLRMWGGNLSAMEQLPEGPFFAVLSFQTAYSMISTQKNKIFELFSELKRRSDLLVVDEAHQALAETYRFNIEQLQKHDTKVIGLTATPGRHGVGQTDEETRRLAEFFDGNIQNIDEFCQQREGQTPLNYLQDRGILSRVKYSPLKTDYKLELNDKERDVLVNTLEFPKSVLAAAAEDSQRNALIIAQIIKLVEDLKKKVLVFAPTKENSSLLAALLNLRSIKARSVTSDTSFTERQSSVRDFKAGEFDVLLNYGVFTTGFDEPSIDCVLIARPTTSVVLYSQMAGRGLRGLKNGGTAECLLVDVVDNLDNQPDIDLANRFFEDAWENDRADTLSLE